MLDGFGNYRYWLIKGSVGWVWVLQVLASLRECWLGFGITGIGWLKGVLAGFGITGIGW